MGFKKTEINDFSFRPFNDIGNNWALLTAGKPGSFNSMTVSWGAAGTLWSRPSVFVFVRPQRYTYEFMEKNDTFSLSLMPEGYHSKMAVFGSKSGRDCDKYAVSGFETAEYEGTVYCKQAKTVFICRKTACTDMNAQWFKDESINSENYNRGDYHRMYVGEVTAVLEHE